MTIVSHLRMEGKYRLTTADAPREKHEHLQFVFTDGSALRYDDVRKFGRLQLVETGTERIVTGIKHLGPEALSPEFTEDYFAKALKNKTKKIKNLLLDQTVVAGLGNIYVDEVLWQAKINPVAEPKDLTKQQVQDLYEAINSTIKEATKLGGTTVHSFLNAEGQAGGYQDRLEVYGRAGEDCLRCGENWSRSRSMGGGPLIVQTARGSSHDAFLGLTGGIATGKSTASKILQDMGCQIIDTDLIAHQQAEVGQAGWLAIKKEFGDVFLKKTRPWTGKS